MSWLKKLNSSEDDNNNLELVVLALTLVGWAVLVFTKLEHKDKLSIGVLWLTAWVVVYYSLETKKLRLVSLSQLKVQKETMKNEFLPIIYPTSGMVQGQLLRLELINKGKGIAKHIEIVINPNLKFTIPSLSEKLPEENKFEWRDDKISKITTDQKNKDIRLELRYKDIYNRSYKTTGITFYRDEPEPGNRFQLNKSNWDFIRKYNQK